MKRKVVLSVFALLLVIGALVIGMLGRPTDDLAFLEQWRPIHERRVGDMAHPGDPNYGEWTVVRFGNPFPWSGPELAPEMKKRWLAVPNLEDEFVKRMPSLVVKPTSYVPDASFVDTIRSPDGGADRFLWIASGMNMNSDQYQIWIKHESWWERTWASLKHHLGL